MILVNFITQIVIWQKGWKYPLKDWLVARANTIHTPFVGDVGDNGEGNEPQYRSHRDMYQLEELGEVEIRAYEEPGGETERSTGCAIVKQSNSKTRYILR